MAEFERKRKIILTDDDRGVVKLMQNPEVAAAVFQILAASESNGGEHSSENGSAAPLPPKKKKLAEAEAAADEEEPEEPPLELVHSATLTEKQLGKATLPPIEQMRAAGYQGNAASMRDTWAWAKDGAGPSRDGLVWPTPGCAAAEAVRYDVFGWPGAKTTCEEWLSMLSFWTALREQMVCGASRAGRKAVDQAFSGFRASRR